MAVPTASPHRSSVPLSYDQDSVSAKDKSQPLSHPPPQPIEDPRLLDWLKKLRPDQQNGASGTSRPIRQTESFTQTQSRPSIARRCSRQKVGVGIPRSATFRRQEEEQRKNLEPVEVVKDRRTLITRGPLRQRAVSVQSKAIKLKQPRREASAPDLGHHHDPFPSIESRMNANLPLNHSDPPERAAITTSAVTSHTNTISELPRVATVDDASSQVSSQGSDEKLDRLIDAELEQKWILNLSMHFKDRSPREKFFVTYAERPEHWRRVTISCDYRNAEPDSLEADLQFMTSQREKSARIYESLRGSLEDIQFYNSVTNLKLETKDERLHVHVTEDVNEIISYPPAKILAHLEHISRFKESQLHFREHMSGFVYKVDVTGQTWIKKEIPGPDSVDEFLYEVNALSRLLGANNVIQLQGLVVSEDGGQIKGLLIAFAEKNALVDIIYDNQGQLPWYQREQWARQIVRGLSHIHRAGFVQGDFTLSNIVVDREDHAQIIDINRRGCPMGWEPPELAILIANGQRISMYIGVKSDIFQLGMVLYALAVDEDEPERQPRPLNIQNAPSEVPEYYRQLVSQCLDPDPANRPEAAALLRYFPASIDDPMPSRAEMPELHAAHPIPSSAIIQGDSSRAEGRRTRGIPSRAMRSPSWQPTEVTTTVHRHPDDRSDMEFHDMLSAGAQTYDTSPRRLSSRSDGAASTHATTLPPDSVLPPSSSVPAHQEEPLFATPSNVETSYDYGEDDDEEDPQIIAISPTGEPTWEEITMGGTPYLVHRDTLDSLDNIHDNDGACEQISSFKSPFRRRVYHWRGADDTSNNHIPMSHRFRHLDFSHVDSGLADMDIPPSTPSERHAIDKPGIEGKHAGGCTDKRNSATDKTSKDHVSGAYFDQTHVFDEKVVDSPIHQVGSTPSLQNDNMHI